MEEAPTTGLVGAVRNVAAGVVEALELRLELVGIELQHEKRRLFAVVFLAMAAALSGFMAMLFANLVLVVTFWEYRGIVMAGLAVFHLLLAVVLSFVVRRRYASAAVPFAGTVAEFRKDRAAFGGKG